jgi:TIR domain
MSATTEHPKIFISYSWTNPEHEQFVIELATALRSHGVDAILDKWDLKPGQDKYVFMESMVVDPQVGRVLVVCDRKYQEKANARAGGVGTESQIISQELYGKVKQTKFIPLVCEYDDEGQACLPVFMKGLIYIDLSSDERYGEGLDELLRLIYEQPFHQKPLLGAAPAFVASGGVSYVRELTSALRSIREGKSNRQGLEAQFMKGLSGELAKLYVQPSGDAYDEGVYQAIVATKGLRDQLADYVDTVAGFSNDDTASLGPFFKLMDDIGSRFGPPIESGSFYPGWSDFYGFFGLEAMLLQTAALLRHQRWKSLNRLLSGIYVVRNGNGESKPASFVAFDAQLVSLDEHRNRRLGMNRISMSADLLKERCGADTVPFSEMLQADVFLTLRSIVQLGAGPADEWPTYWALRTSVYAPPGNKHPVFMRAADSEIRAGLRTALNVASAADLSAKLESAGQRMGGFQRLSNNRSFSHFNFQEAVNLPLLVK